MAAADCLKISIIRGRLCTSRLGCLLAPVNTHNLVIDMDYICRGERNQNLVLVTLNGTGACFKRATKLILTWEVVPSDIEAAENALVYGQEQ